MYIPFGVIFSIGSLRNAINFPSLPPNGRTFCIKSSINLNFLSISVDNLTCSEFLDFLDFFLSTLPFFIFLPKNVSMKPSSNDICSFLISIAIGKSFSISSSSKSSKCVALSLDISANLDFHFSATALQASLILLHLRIS